MYPGLFRSPSLPLVEEEEDGQDDAAETREIVPAQLLLQVKHGKDGEDAEGDYFLNGLELRGGELIGADAVGRDLEAVFEKGDAPAGDDDFPERLAAVFEVAVPGKGHEDVGNRQQDYGSHGFAGLLLRREVFA